MLYLTLLFWLNALQDLQSYLEEKKTFLLTLLHEFLFEE